MRRWEQLLAALAVSAVVHAAWGLNGLPECGKAESPECNGECPPGLRCTQMSRFIFEGLREPAANASANGPQLGIEPEEPPCACLEVACGGVPLEDGQGCCNGEVTDLVNATVQCPCSPEPARVACCENEGPSGRSLAIYSYNLPIDCCAGTPCGGSCRGAECAGEDCCVCEPVDNPNAGPPPACAAADSDVGCKVGCFFSPEGIGTFPVPGFGLANHSGVRIEGGTCGEEGCIPPRAEAPAASSTGLALSVVCLAAIGALTLLRRRRQST
jgi:hypothetical protein